MGKASNHTAAILAAITKFGDNCTTGDIAEALGLSASRTREVLALEIKAGTIDRHHAEVDGCKVLVYTIGGKVPAPVEAVKETAETLVAPKATKAATKAKATKPAKVKTVKTPKEKKPRRKASGIGKPNAKKVVNPQQTLDLKKAMIERNKGKMIWANRIWTISANGKSEQFKSRDLAALTLEALAKMFGITV